MATRSALRAGRRPSNCPHKDMLVLLEECQKGWLELQDKEPLFEEIEDMPTSFLQEEPDVQHDPLDDVPSRLK